MKSKITAAPYLLWALILIIIPLILVAIFALTDTSGGFTLDNFKNSLEYAPVIFNSIWLSIIATGNMPCACISACICDFETLEKQTAHNGELVMLPMWMNFLLRTYAWMTLLENQWARKQIFRTFWAWAV